MVDRLPPHSIDAEESVLGSLIIDGEAITKIFNQLKASDFYSERNSCIYKACVDLYTRREKINSVTIFHELERDSKAENCGGAAYLAHLVSVVPTSLDIESYANIVYRLSLSRRLIETSEKLAEIGYKELSDPEEILNQVTATVNKFNQDHAVLSNKIITPVMAANIMVEMLEEYNEHKEFINCGCYLV